MCFRNNANSLLLLILFLREHLTPLFRILVSTEIRKIQNIHYYEEVFLLRPSNIKMKYANLRLSGNITFLESTGFFFSFSKNDKVPFVRI